MDRVVQEYEALFVAERKREEEVAADDLARSLRQGESLAVLLDRTPLSMRKGDRFLPIDEVGNDFVVLDDARWRWVVPSDALATLLARSGPPPFRSRDFLTARLRRIALARESVRIEAAEGWVEGSLVLVGQDYCRVRERTKDVIVPLATVRAIRLPSHADSTDAS